MGADAGATRPGIRGPRPSPLRVLVVCALALLAACEDPQDPLPPGIEYFTQVEGTWRYVASEIRLADRPEQGVCAVEGLTLELVQVPRAGAFSGRSRGGDLRCSAGLAELSGPLRSYPIGDGYTFNEFVAFDLGTADWRHDGRIARDSMSGHFELRNGAIRLQGRFVARRSDR